MNAEPDRVRRVFDWIIYLVFLGASVFYFPKLTAFVRHFTEPIVDPRGMPAPAAAIFVLGLIPWVGSLGMLIPCLSYFTPPLARGRRLALGGLCLVPLLLAGLGVTLSHREFAAFFLRLGLICSAGIWFFALPPALANQGINQFFYRLLLPRPDPRPRRRRPNRPE
jgi:phosphatidylserine synthase